MDRLFILFWFFPYPTLLSAGRAEVGLAGERDAMLKVAAWTEVARVPTVRIPAKHESLNGFLDVGTLIGGDVAFQTMVAPELPMIAEDLTKSIMPSRMIGMTP
jgi:hypothetical protein